MADHKPPRLDGGERDTLLALLSYQRESLIRKVAELDASSASLSPVDSGTNLLWLILHMARAEVTWVQFRFAGMDVEVPDDAPTAGETPAHAIGRYREVSRSSDRIVLDAPSLDETCRRADAPERVNLRWVLMHLLEETARHAGHADILRELIDGETGR
jgi:uncharacterized damage-inducible protein DinB